MNRGFILKEKKGVKFYVFKDFEKTGFVKHCITTRIGGIHEELNMKENIYKNHELISNILDIDFKKMVVSDQIHGKSIYKVSQKDCGKGIIGESDIIGVDGLFTNERGIPLITYFADCVPLLFVDTKRKVIANIHAGWKGTVLKIAQETLKRLVQEYGTKPENILVGIGPSIGRCCYEIDEPVISRVIEAFPDYWEELIIKGGNREYYFDLWKANALQLIEMGVRKENVITSGVCTSCNNRLLFSHRKEKGKTGRFAAVIQLI